MQLYDQHTIYNGSILQNVVLRHYFNSGIHTDRVNSWLILDFWKSSPFRNIPIVNISRRLRVVKGEKNKPVVYQTNVKNVFQQHFVVLTQKITNLCWILCSCPQAVGWSARAHIDPSHDNVNDEIMLRHRSMSFKQVNHQFDLFADWKYQCSLRNRNIWFR